MADFCKQCSLEIFGKDFGELANLAVGPLEAGHGWQALCEDCGWTVVDEEGRCIADDCLKHHGKEDAMTTT